MEEGHSDGQAAVGKSLQKDVRDDLSTWRIFPVGRLAVDWLYTLTGWTEGANPDRLICAKGFS